MAKIEDLTLICKRHDAWLEIHSDYVVIKRVVGDEVKEKRLCNDDIKEHPVEYMKQEIVELGKDEIQLQSDEFDALKALCHAYKNLPAVVDDEYPAMRHAYEGKLREFAQALVANRGHAYCGGVDISIVRDWAWLREAAENDEKFERELEEAEKTLSNELRSPV